MPSPLSKQKNRPQLQTGFNPVFLATYLTWLQADRPNHHGISCNTAVDRLRQFPEFGFVCDKLLCLAPVGCAKDHGNTWNLHMTLQIALWFEGLCAGDEA
jgi:hypothetical protein